jgi:hypothetical protein
MSPRSTRLPEGYSIFPPHFQQLKRIGPVPTKSRQ